MFIRLSACRDQIVRRGRARTSRPENPADAIKNHAATPKLQTNALAEVQATPAITQVSADPQGKKLHAGSPQDSAEGAVTGAR